VLRLSDSTCSESWGRQCPGGRPRHRRLRHLYECRLLQALDDRKGVCLFFYSFSLGKFIDLVIHLGEQFIAEPFSDIHEQGGIKGWLFDIGTVSQKILESLSRSSGYMFSVIWATVSRSSKLSMCLIITAPIKTQGFRAGLPVDLAGLRLLNRLTS